MGAHKITLGPLMPIEPIVEFGDIVDQTTDVIVNAWNPNLFPFWLLVPQGVSRAIRREAGNLPFHQVWKHGYMPPGAAVLTSAGRLPAKAIVHVAGINLLWQATELSIARSVESTLMLVNQHKFDSVAFPVIGAGTGGFDQGTALSIMTSTLKRIDSTATVVIVRWKL